MCVVGRWCQKSQLPSDGPQEPEQREVAEAQANTESILGILVSPWDPFLMLGGGRDSQNVFW